MPLSKGTGTFMNTNGIKQAGVIAPEEANNKMH